MGKENQELCTTRPVGNKEGEEEEEKEDDDIVESCNPSKACILGPNVEVEEEEQEEEAEEEEAEEEEEKLPRER